MPSAGTSWPPSAPRQRSRAWFFPWALVGALMAFSLGLIANPWFERSVREHLPGRRGSAGSPSPERALRAGLLQSEQRLAALDRRVARLEAGRRTEGGPALAPGLSPDDLARLTSRVDTIAQSQVQQGQRLDSLHAELSDMDRQLEDLEGRAGDALADAERAREVLLTTSARQALEAGHSLTTIGPALQQAFGAEAQSAVEDVVALGADPVTAGRLARDLDRLQPAVLEALGARGPDRSIWTELRRWIGSIVRVGTGPDSTSPAARLQAAKRALASAQPSTAISIVEQLPGPARTALADWLIDARRYAAGLRGLERLEAAAIARERRAPAEVRPAAPAPAPDGVTL